MALSEYLNLNTNSTKPQHHFTDPYLHLDSEVGSTSMFYPNYLLLWWISLSVRPFLISLLRSFMS